MGLWVPRGSQSGEGAFLCILTSTSPTLSPPPTPQSAPVPWVQGRTHHIRDPCLRPPGKDGRGIACQRVPSTGAKEAALPCSGSSPQRPVGPGLVPWCPKSSLL